MSGLCDRCMKREARSAHDLYCDECEDEIHHPDQAIAAKDAELAAQAQRIARLLFALNKFGVHAEPGCAFWAGMECDCGLGKAKKETP